jgi:ABC-2 type transport system permease protein
VYPAVAMAMWSAAVSGADGDIQGMDGRDFAAYFLLTMVVGHVSSAWDIFEMGYQVRTGAMSPRLLQPLLPVWSALADNLAYKVLTLALLIPIWLGTAWLVEPRFTAGPGTLVLGVVASVLSAAVHYVWQYNVGMTAFWITRTEAVAEMWWGSNLLFGGRIAPIGIMPVPLQWLAALLPFQWVIWFPSAALAGQLETGAIVRGLGVQVLWLAGGLVAFQIIWRRGVRRYAAVGA